MCGIIGSTHLDRVVLERAASTFRYRGPDATAFFFDTQIALGHHRLSIIDVAARADQPMWDEEKTVGIVFNGEIYNFQALKQELSSRYSFRTTSDTEVFLYAYKEWGVACLQRFHGMFACAIYDTRQQKLLLCRDAMGIKPLYYAYHEGYFSFASELKGLTKLFREEGIVLERNQEAIELYSVFGYVPSPLTLYRSMWKLPRSSWLEFDLTAKTEPVVHSYVLEDPPVQNEEEFANIIEERTLEHLVADVPVGVFFSGGTDSSLIASILQKHRLHLKAFSLRMKGKEQDEYYFNTIAQKLGIEATVLTFGVKEFDEVYPLVMCQMDEPLADNSLFPTFYLSREAAKRVKVVVSGEGGDELFLGYPRDLALARLQGAVDRYSWLDRLYTSLPFFPAKNAIFERIFLLARKPVSYYLVHMSPARGLLSAAAWRRTKEFMQYSKSKPLFFDRDFYLENDLLKKLDMATSYASIEGRVPLLDRAIVANAEHFLSRHLQEGILKAFLKRLLCRYLPSELVYRGKSGFGMNLHEYFHQSIHLKADLRKAIYWLKQEKVFIPSFAETNLEGFIRRSPNYGLALISLYYALRQAEMD